MRSGTEWSEFLRFFPTYSLILHCSDNGEGNAADEVRRLLLESGLFIYLNIDNVTSMH